MIICEHPEMIETKCFNGKEGCCRHCGDVKRCMDKKDDDYLCPYIKNNKDLEYKCPFESK